MLYVSTHQYGIYPGTGPAEDIGEGEGQGFTVNVPFPAGAGDTSYRAALETLPAEQRDVFLLYESGLSLDEVATISAVGMETAKSRLRYAVAKLRATLAPVTETFSSTVSVIQEPGA